MSGRSERLSLELLIDIAGRDAFDAACREAMSVVNDSIESDVPHVLSNRLWYSGSESFADRLDIAVELYLRMPTYANLMYWRRRDFDRLATERMWKAYRRFLGDPRDTVGHPAAYSLWVDFFEDPSTVAEAWSEVASPQEPRRPRLERVIRASGPVPWALKEPLYDSLAREGRWDDDLVAALYGSCVDLYGSLDHRSALRLLRSLRTPTRDRRYLTLSRALADPALPDSGADRRFYVSQLLKQT